MQKITNTIDFDIDYEEIEKRKNRVRRIWNYNRVDHIPIGIFVTDNKDKFTMKDILTDEKKNLRYDLNSVKKSLELLPDDYIPFLKPETGSVTLASILGCEVDYGNIIEDYPRVKSPIIREIKDLDKIKIPLEKDEISLMGLMPLNLKKIRYYNDITKNSIDITGFDLGGAMNTAQYCTDSNLFYISLLDEKDRMKEFINSIGDLHLETLKIITETVGDINKMTTVDWEPFWFPEDYKGCLCDDTSANYSIDIFEEFSKPNCKKIYDIYGYGEFHNCGPHPCIAAYIDYGKNQLKVINVSLLYTLNEMDEFLSPLENTDTIVTFLIEDYHYGPEKALSMYEEAIKKEVNYNIVCIPTYYPLDTLKYSDDEIRDIFNEFLRINTEYANSLKLK